MATKVTRRVWTAAVLGSAAAAAQPPQPPQPQAATPQTAEEWLAAQRAQLTSNAELLAKHKLPAGIEPAFVFKA